MYYVFCRTFWKENPDWPNGLEPYPGKRHVVQRGLTAEEARSMCKRLNEKKQTAKEERLGLKYEFSS